MTSGFVSKPDLCYTYTCVVLLRSPGLFGPLVSGYLYLYLCLLPPLYVGLLQKPLLSKCRRAEIFGYFTKLAVQVQVLDST